ncbi:MAG: metallophosphoesterase [Lacipirellulaceae bacterium]
MLLLTALVLGSSLASADPFRFVTLPDTQVYSENLFPNGPGSRPNIVDPQGTFRYFTAQTQWIADNAAAQNIGYVSHLGDIIENGGTLAAAAEWARARQAMDTLLTADIPHGTAMGNHDDDPSQGPNYRADYLANFGPARYAGKAWYNASPSGAANYTILEHEGRKIGFVNFSIDQPADEIAWANNVIASNRDTMFVLGTHRYMYDFKLAAARYGEVNVSPIGTFNIIDPETLATPDYRTGQQLYDDVIAGNRNVFMINSGHFHSEWIRETARPGMEKVVEVLTDYQDGRNGGDGWLRVYTMDFDNNKLDWRTYSPVLNEDRSVLHHFVETIQQAWANREQVKPLLGIPAGAATDSVYLGFINQNLKDNPQVPNNFLALHPDFGNGQKWNNYLADMFGVSNGGTIPAGFTNLLEWENLWLAAFAKNPLNPLDFSAGVRSPSGSTSLNYDSLIPEPTSLALVAGGALLALRRSRR